MRSPEEIEAAVMRAFTGNRTHDLIGVALDEIEHASDVWEREANRRHLVDEHRRRRGDRWR